jgi:hypothetical protein
MKKLLLLLCLVAFAGTIQQDPIFPNNYIVRDKDGRRVEYWIKDPIIENNWLRFGKDKKQGTVLKDPILKDHWRTYDTSE